VQLRLQSRCAVLCIAFLACACTAPSVEQDVTALNRLQRQVDSSITSGDIERYLTFMSEDAVLMPPNGAPVAGKPAIRAWSQSMSKQFRITSYSSVDDEVIVAGDWAFRRTAFAWTIQPLQAGAPMRDTGKYIIVYRRATNRSWQVARDIWNTSTRAP
jgi:ketosteroid isomerase-like protein